MKRYGVMVCSVTPFFMSAAIWVHVKTWNLPTGDHFIKQPKMLEVQFTYGEPS
jgi:hypothetical protein